VSEKVRIGLIGTSWFADLYHLPILKSHPRAELVAICGRDPARAREMATKFAIPAVFADYRAMLEQAGLDAVVIATPDDQHYPMTMAALDAGLHVLCEKPLALTVEHARAMYARAEAARVKHMVNFSYRWFPLYRYLHELIESGYLGRCYHCDISYLSDYARAGQYRWRFDPARAHGVLGDFGPHVIDLARLFVGEVRRVSAHLAAFVPLVGPNGAVLESANQSAYMTIEFENGAQGAIHMSGMAQIGGRVQEQHIALHGEAGALVSEFQLAGWRMEITGVRAAEKEFQQISLPDRLWGDAPRDDVLALYQRQSVADRLFVDAILADRPIEPSFLDGLKAQEVIAAAITSHQTGSWVALG
jgi:predicted dehydrogenase